MSEQRKSTHLTRVVAASFEEAATFLRELQFKVEIKDITIFESGETSVSFVPDDFRKFDNPEIDLRT